MYNLTALKLASAAATAALAVCLASTGSTAMASPTVTLTIGPGGPGTPTSSDVYNLVGSSNDFGNVNTSASGGYGGTLYGASGSYGNDQYQYVSSGRPAQGQTFTTGNNPTGYTLTNIWVQHPGYTNATTHNPGYNGTYWDLATGTNLTLRITTPSGAGALTVLQTDSYTATGNESTGTFARRQV